MKSSTFLAIAFALLACGGGSDAASNVDDTETGDPFRGIRIPGQQNDVASLDDVADGGASDAAAPDDDHDPPRSDGGQTAGGSDAADPEDPEGGEAGAGQAGPNGAGAGGDGAGEGGSVSSGEAGMGGSTGAFVPTHEMFIGTWNYERATFQGAECPEPSVPEMMARAEAATYSCSLSDCDPLSFDADYALTGLSSAPRVTFDRWEGQIWVGQPIGTYYTPMFWLVSEDEMLGFIWPNETGILNGAMVCYLFKAVRQ
jgi:hypothetical protein